MTKKAKHDTLVHRTQQLRDLQNENEQLKARLAEYEKRGAAPGPSREGSAVEAASAVDAFIICDSQLTVTDVDEAALRYFGVGLHREDVIGKDLADLMTDGERYEQYLNVVETGERFVVEESLIMPDVGEVRIITRAFRAGDGLGILITDITERKRTEGMLQASEEKYRTLADQSIQGIMIAQGAPPHVVYCNAAMADIAGRSVEEMVSLPPQQMGDLVHPEDRAAFFRRFADRLEGLPVESRYKIRGIRQDGAIRWLEVFATAIEYQNEPAVQAVFVDITDREKAEEALRESEEKYKRLFESTQTAMEVISLETGLVVLANEATARMFDFASADDLVGVDSMRYLRPEDVGWVSSRMAEAVGQNWQEISELQVRTNDGRWIWVSGMTIATEYQGKPALLVSMLDITRLKQTEETLRASEEKYRLLTEKTNDLIFTTGLNLRDTYVSPSVERILGFTPEEHLARDENQQLTPESLARAQQALLGHLALERDPKADPNRMARIELEYYRKDGSTVWLENQVSGIRDPNGVLVGFHGLARDVTERRQAEEKLRKSEERFRQITENMLDAVSVLDEKGIILYASPSHERIVGYSTEDLVGKSVFDFLCPDDVDSVMASMDGILESGEARYHYRFRHADGHWVWGEASARLLLDDSGNASRFVIASRDVSDRKAAEDAMKASEEKFRLLTEKTNDLIFTTDLNLRDTYVSPSVERILGFTPEEHLAQDVTQRLTPESLARARQVLLDHLALERDPEADPDRTVRIELEHYRKEGSTVWLEDQVSGIRDGNGILVGFHGVARDISERRRLEEERREREEGLRAIIENAWDGITILDENYRATFESPSLARIAGYTPEEWIGRPVGQMNIHPDDLGPLLAKIEILRSQPGSVITDVTVRYQHKDGSWRWIEATGHNLLHDPKVKGLVVNFRDITARLEMEEAQRDSEQRFRTLIEKATDVVIVLDATGKITYQSPSLERVTGFGHNEWLNRSLGELLINPDDMVAVTSLLERVLGEPGKTVEGVTVRYQHKDGSWHVLEATVTNMLHDPKVNGLVANFRDVTERVQAAEALVASEAKYRNLFEHTMLGMEVVDGQTGKTVLANRSLARMFGFAAPADMIGTNPLDYVLPEDLEWVTGQIAELMGDPAWNRQAVIRSRTEDGRIIWLAGMTTPFEYEGEAGMLISVVDITLAKEAELKLQESEEKNRLLIDNSAETIIVVQDGLLRFVNRRVTEFIGYSAEEVLSRPFTDFVHPDDRQRIAEYYARRMAGKEVPATYQSRVIDKQGNVKWAEIRADVFTWEGKPAVMAMLSDVTERKHAEEELREAHAELEARVEQRTAELREANVLLTQEISRRQEAQDKLEESEGRYRGLVESANSVILELDMKGKITFFNRFAQEFFGFPESEIIGRHIVGTIAPDVDSDGKDRKALTRDLIKHPENYLVIENEGMRRNGERVWISWTTKGIYDAKGRLRNILCIGMDRTEQKRVAEMLAQQMKEKAAADERQRLARDLHDAVTQMLFSANLIAAVLPKLWAKDAAEGQRRLEELRQLTRGALAEMRMLLMELRPASLAEAGLVDLLRHLAESAAGRSGFPVAFSVEGECAAPVEVQIALYRVAQEALNNVVKHSGASAAEIRLSCRGNSVRLTISDNGSGFDPKGVSPAHLGLRIMRERAEAVGGVLKVVSSERRGTRVAVVWTNARRKEGS